MKLLIPLLLISLLLNSSISANIIDYYELEAPRLSKHVIPVITKPFDKKENPSPLIDILVGDDGKPIGVISIGNTTGPDIDILKQTCSSIRFTPAFASGKPTEGLYRYIPKNYFYLSEEYRDRVSQLPVPKFLLSAEVLSYIKLKAGGFQKNSILLEFTIDENGSIEKIEDETTDEFDPNYSQTIRKVLTSILPKENAFMPGHIDGKPSKIKLKLLLNFRPGGQFKMVKKLFKGIDKQKPMPLKPKSIEYESPKTYQAELIFTGTGVLFQIRLMDQMELGESVSAINAFRNWFIGRGGNKIQKKIIEFTFTNESKKALLVSEVDSTYQPPKAVKQIPPIYPRNLSSRGITGGAVMQFVVDKKGKPVGISAFSKTHKEFEEAAKNAISKWKFEPGEINGEKINTRVQILIPFSISTVIILVHRST